MVADYEASVQCILYPRAYTGGRHKFISTGRASNGVGKLWTYERAAQKRPIAACEGGGESDVSQDDGWQSTSSAIAEAAIFVVEGIRGLPGCLPGSGIPGI
ncbi:hypothetical protein PC113_g11913 [Phytophthora cactorum]|uniref:Uncharacterized protein n=1 Tax=Phytophthora cactorum TaxID=29920 RepID=A0A8T1CMK5_9STRA|nr:hypothetical protein PC112_g11350 [Phytophthora cactorum]KAG2856048.1 hypothetical protein PC113_g11913 [Phytophthora cactorum]KAG2893391.1 hypothetical protein PC114_g16290 [Phytophthora cactorum]KAG2923771.1 hypothetical protein PC117_g15627 [Phytophthora cactorum]KAG3010862.1 hypothetical protein PC120_g14813 [Phytophthora cactorum]